MNKVYCSKLSDSENKSGIMNQFCNLASAIVEAYKQHKKIVAIDNLTFYHSDDTVIPVSAIIDLDKLNVFLESRYGMKVYDKNILLFQLKKVLYGVQYKEKNITEKIVEKYIDENDVVRIGKDINLNTEFGDPFMGVKKRVFIQYVLRYKDKEIPDSISVDEFDGILEEEMVVDMNPKNGDYIAHETNLKELPDKQMFSNILQRISLTEQYEMAAEHFIDEIGLKDKKASKTNILHLRLEDDVVTKWAKQDDKDYLQRLENKYIELIKDNIEKTDDTIILSYSSNNSVLAFLKENGYNYHFNQKVLESGRELNACVDVLTGKYCNNVFIGNFDESTMKGSWFSYFIMNNLPKTVKTRLVSLDSP